MTSQIINWYHHGTMRKVIASCVERRWIEHTKKQWVIASTVFNALTHSFQNLKLNADTVSRLKFQEVQEVGHW
jgi:hypothetical protein